MPESVKEQIEVLLARLAAAWDSARGGIRFRSTFRAWSDRFPAIGEFEDIDDLIAWFQDEKVTYDEINPVAIALSLLAQEGDQAASALLYFLFIPGFKRVLHQLSGPATPEEVFNEMFGTEFGKPRVREKQMWAPSLDECLAMLKIPDRKTVRGLRDLVLLYLLVDTGLRVSAVSTIRVRDVDIPERRVRVLEKGERERVLPLGVQTLRWIRRYLAASRLELDAYLFPGRAGRAISRKRIDEIVKHCAWEAGVRQGKVSAHDFRRAFSREFLRNGGDIESLRQLLGHSSYAMVKRYAELASDVVAEQHRKASPGDRLQL